MPSATPPADRRIQALRWWCDSTFGGDWKKAFRASRKRGFTPFPVHPTIPKNERVHWVAVCLTYEGAALLDCGLGCEVIPWKMVTGAT